MRVLLTGATGFIGQHLHRALLAEGHDVVACSRQHPGLPCRAFIPCDFAQDLKSDDWLPRLNDVDAVINAVGIIRETGLQRFQSLHTDAPKALFKACAECNISRVIQISALGADEQAETNYHLSKREADDFLAKQPLDWLILRPSLVYGPGSTSSELFAGLAALPLTPLIGDGQQPVQPIHIDDLVKAVLTALTSKSPSRQRIDCVGPRALSFQYWLNGWRKWLGKATAPSMRVPFSLAQSGARVCAPFSRLPVDAESLQMLQRGNAAPVEPFTRAFGFTPQCFEHSIEQRPASPAERQQAGLFFLWQLLRLSLAFMWIWTGLTSAFWYPVSDSYQMLSAVGLSGVALPIALYAAALLDTLLGLALLLNYRLRLVLLTQVAMMLGYSLILSFCLPEFWLHPFGPISKNLPLIVASLMLYVREGDAP
ncbi:SDR family oxidoreductase [Marinobacterium stanieri]|uniref:SDR family oxidoreductase n=1 Tax=Marinobacterium stanieri TaxID=49186 RepID=UPI0002557CBD|nr:SDR family oxidoreductase [Marinobacterium stanieri]